MRTRRQPSFFVPFFTERGGGRGRCGSGVIRIQWDVKQGTGTRRYSYNRNSGNYGGYARNDSRFGRENRNMGYSRGMDWTESLRMMMDEAPDEATRMDIKKLMDRKAN